MKTFLSFVCILFATELIAQKNCKVTISGDSCNFTSLVSYVKGSEALTLKWKRDTTLMMVRKPNGYSSSGNVVAGGNGEGSGLNQLNFPWAFDIDSAGNL